MSRISRRRVNSGRTRALVAAPRSSHGRHPEGSKVLLVSMPFGALERQALGLSLLKAQLAREGIACDVRYLNFPFAEFMGHDDYRWLTYDVPHTAFAGEWCFTAQVYGEQRQSDDRYIERILRDTWRLSDAEVERIQRARSLTTPFLDYCMEAVPWERYRIVGFTSTFAPMPERLDAVPSHRILIHRLALPLFL